MMVHTRWYIAVPRKLPYSYHCPPLWINYSYTGTLKEAYEKAIQVFEEEGWLDKASMNELIYEFDNQCEDEYMVWKSRWRRKTNEERKHVIHQMKQNYVTWNSSAHTETAHGLVKWDAIPNQDKLCWGDSALAVIELS